MSVMNGNATPNGTRMMCTPNVKAICWRAAIRFEASIMG